jgi:hypothetical protein
MTHFFGQLLTPPTIANRDRDRTLRLTLTYDVPIQLTHNFTR